MFRLTHGVQLRANDRRFARLRGAVKARRYARRRGVPLIAFGHDDRSVLRAVRLARDHFRHLYLRFREKTEIILIVRNNKMIVYIIPFANLNAG